MVYAVFVQYDCLRLMQCVCAIGLCIFGTQQPVESFISSLVMLGL